MGGFGDAIKYLYEKFILRDVLSFITPGAIIVLTAVYLLCPDFLYRSIHWLLYIPLFGFFFMVGFAVQCFGEMFGFIRHTPKGDKSCLCQRLGIWNCKKWGDNSAGWWHQAHEDVVKFARKNQHPGLEWARDRHERFIVLKQMCANGSVAIAIAGCLLVIKLLLIRLHASPEATCIASTVLVAIVVVLLLPSLFWGFRVHALKEDDWRNVIMSRQQSSD